MENTNLNKNQNFERKYYLDWLRILATLLLFVFHTARCFDIGEANYIENPDPSNWITIFGIWIINIFHMPLFFFISGAASKLALQRISFKKYSKLRLLRLLIPFIFGILIIVPPQPFYAAKYHNNFQGSFFDFYKSYFQTGFQDISGYRGTLTPAHLWFILVLFLLSIFAIPLMMGFNSPKFHKFEENMVKNKRFFWIILIPLILIGGSFALPSLLGKPIVFYFVIFLYGYIFIGNNTIEQYIVQKRKIWLIIASIGLIYASIVNIDVVYFNNRFDIPWLITSIISYLITMWTFLLTIVGYSKKNLNITNKFHKYFSLASYPLYILHQTAIIILAYYIVQWSIFLWLKFILIILLSFLLSVIVYEFIRKIKIFNWGLGIKSKKRKKNKLESKSKE